MHSLRERVHNNNTNNPFFARLGGSSIVKKRREALMEHAIYMSWVRDLPHAEETRTDQLHVVVNQ